LVSERFEEYAVVGELALEGNTRPVKGALSMAIAAARQQGLRGLVVPTSSAAEAAVVEDIEAIPVASLTQAVGFFAGSLQIEPAPARLDEWFEEFSKYEEDFADVRGQEMAKRALTIAAAGGHNLLTLYPVYPFTCFLPFFPMYSRQIPSSFGDRKRQPEFLLPSLTNFIPDARLPSGTRSILAPVL